MSSGIFATARAGATRAEDDGGVGGALVSIALVLCAVFVPTAFLGGITGQFFQQFAITIAVATAISCFCSLTLSPALASLILEPHDEKRPPRAGIHRPRLGKLPACSIAALTGCRMAMAMPRTS